MSNFKNHFNYCEISAYNNLSVVDILHQYRFWTGKSAVSDY